MMGKMPKNKWYHRGNRWFTSRKSEDKFYRIADAVAEANEEALLADGFEGGLVGVAYRFGIDPVACYDRATCIGILMDRDGMTEEDAEDFFCYNVIGSGVDHAPIFIQTVE